MSASSLHQIDGFATSGFGFRDGLRSVMNGVVCQRIVSPGCDSSCNDIAKGVVGKPANVRARAVSLVEA